MNVESNSNSLFQPIVPELVAEIANKIPSISSLFAYLPNQSLKINLKLINNTIILLEPNSFDTFLTLSFETKFQVIYEQEKNIFSQKIGIHLYDEELKSINLYSSQPVILEWIFKLSKKINQKGFHQMFKPIRKLGKGNFATVYEAERLTDHQHFAVKAFSKQNSYNAKNGKASLINEINIMRQLNHEPHPNVLKLEGVFESQNSIYVVLELLCGHTLFQKIQERKGDFNKEEVKQIVGGLLSGVHHIHSHRIMHRDLKPENIMLRGESLEPVIVDFGLATNADLKEYLFFRCGTPGYVAPEITQLTQCAHIEPICDMFSLGAIFHILLVKKPLFEGTKYDQVYRNNKEMKFKLQGDTFKQVESSAFQLLKEMLVIIPSKRISAKDALNHSFFKQTEMEIEVNIKTSLPSSTDVSASGQKKKKRTFFIF